MVPLLVPVSREYLPISVPTSKDHAKFSLDA
jgi:hypothetical protein